MTMLITLDSGVKYEIDSDCVYNRDDWFTFTKIINKREKIVAAFPSKSVVEITNKQYTTEIK